MNNISYCLGQIGAQSRNVTQRNEELSNLQINIYHNIYIITASRKISYSRDSENLFNAIGYVTSDLNTLNSQTDLHDIHSIICSFTKINQISSMFRNCFRCHGYSWEQKRQWLLCPMELLAIQTINKVGTTCSILHAKLLQSCLILCDPIDCSLPASSVHGLPYPPPGHLPDPGIKPASLTSRALAGRFFTTSATWEALSQRSLFFSGFCNT